MKITRLISVAAAVGLAATALALAGPANAGPGTYLTDNSFGYSSGSEALNLFAAGNILDVPSTQFTSCDSFSPVGHASLNVLNTKLAKLSLLTDKCSWLDGDSSASEHIAAVNLFNGALKLTAIDSNCSVVDGEGKVGSTVGKVNGQNLTAGTGKVLNIPGLATVTINQNGEDAGVMFTEAVVVNVFPVYVGGHQVTPAQTIIIGACAVFHTT